ncbi:MAG: cyclase family protein [Chloroflexi bacterium]|nr:MAG: cyclase family protein [Chloroflexota bacterium]MBL1193490.1 cyclase family protein [Chloroflexota bacterium]NOH10781.1 cyclase family protein [Chloroflexota bacterium]
MQTYDITLTISPDMVVWPEDPPLSLERVSKIEDGDVANVSRMELSVHTGTHVDAPFHFLRKGSTVESLELKTLIGRAYVLEIGEDVEQIEVEHVKNSTIPPRTKRVLFKTRNSALWSKAKRHKTFDKKYVAVSSEAAEYLVNRGVKLVGVDYLSVAPFDDVTPTHEILLKAGVIIVEGLDLSAVSQGRYNFYCLPLKIAGSDGAPARAILVGV